MASRSTSSDDNVVAGNVIGTDVSGAVALGQCRAYGASAGVEIDSSSGNTIGGTVAGARDVISGNGIRDVELNGSSDNLIAGDFIGTDVTGTDRPSSVSHGLRAGIAVSPSRMPATGIRSAGRSPARPTSSRAMTGSGIEIDASSDNLVEGDLIGTDVTGTKALGNAQSGVRFDLQNGASFRGCEHGEHDRRDGRRRGRRHLGQRRLRASRSTARRATWSRGTSSAPMPPGRSRWAMPRRASTSRRTRLHPSDDDPSGRSRVLRQVSMI